MKVISLSSGSKGNVTLVITTKYNILIDVGLSMKKIDRLLMMSEGLTLDDIDLVFISHVHQDHLMSFNTIYNKYPHISFFMDTKLKQEVEAKLEKKYDRVVLIDKKVVGNDLIIENFELKHDAYCLGWKVTDISSGDSLVFVADNGSLWDKDIISKLINAEYYCIESNYDELSQYFDTTRNAILKRRVLGNKGHNSNLDAISLATKLIGERTKQVQFTHLSEHTNTPELALKTHLAYLEVWGKLEEWKHILISYGHQNEIVYLDRGKTHKEIRGVK